MFARDDLTSPLNQRSQNTQRLGLNLDRTLPTEKSSGPGIEFEIPEAQSLVAIEFHLEASTFGSPRPQFSFLPSVHAGSKAKYGSGSGVVALYGSVWFTERSHGVLWARYEPFRP
jgi:hypothetical protein